MAPKLLPPPPPPTDDPSALRARLARRDPADWPWILGELRQVATAVAPAFRDVCSPDDVLGELALRTHERWLEDWLAHDDAPPLRLFLRDRLRDHLRELKRTRDRRAELLRGVVPSGGVVESAAGAHEAIFASPPPRPDEALEAAELHGEVARVSGAPSQLIDLRAAGFDQREIAAHTGLSRPTVGRRLAAVAAVMAALAAAGGIVGSLVSAPRSERLEPIAQVVEPAPAPPPSVPAQAPGSLPGAVAPVPPEPSSVSEAPSPAADVPPTPPEVTAPASLPDPEPASSASVEDEARICLANGDYACVIRLLGGGRARTARQLSMLAHAQRTLTGPESACPTVAQLLERFPSAPETNRYRQFHAMVCEDR